LLIILLYCTRGFSRECFIFQGVIATAINYIRQPEGSNLCGQACVAMLTGKSLEEAIAAVGTKGRTSLTGNIKCSLERAGVKLSDCIRLSKNSPLPDFCLIRMRNSNQIGKRTSHLIIYHKGTIYDPAMGVYTLQEFREAFPGVKFNCCLIILEPD